MPSPFSAYILAGGRSTRFGSDKARVPIAGVPAIVSLERQLRSQGITTITAVAREADAYADLGIATISDRYADAGPLAGVEAALTHAKDSSGAACVLVVSCDLFEVRAAWIDRLVSAATPEAGAVAFRAERWEPFPALYRPSLLPVIQARLDAPQAKRSLQRLLDDPESRAVTVPRPDDWPELISFNTPAELQHATRHAR